MMWSKERSVASALASSEFNTSYGRDATSAAYSLGGRIPQKGFTLTIVLSIYNHKVSY